MNILLIILTIILSILVIIHFILASKLYKNDKSIIRLDLIFKSIIILGILITILSFI
jgi:hypothetical protein